MMNASSRKGGSSAVIRELVENRDFDVDRRDAKNQRERFVRDLKKKEREKIVSAALHKFVDAEELKPYQAELIRMQAHLEATGRKAIILFD